MKAWKRTIINALVIVCVVASAIGGVIYDSHRRMAIALIVAGIGGAAYAYISSDKKQTQTDLLENITARLLFGAGFENPYSKLAESMLAKGGTHKEILAYLEQAFTVVPNDAYALAYYSIIAALYLCSRGIVGHRDARPDSPWFRKTASVIERGIATGKRLSDFYASRGMLLDVAGQHHEARRWFDKAGRLRSDPYWRLLKCVSYGMEQDYPHALNEVERAIKEGAVGPPVDFYHGRSLEAMGEYAKALALFQRVKDKRGYNYELVVSIRDTHWYAWRPFKAVWFEILSAKYAFNRSKRKALSHVYTAFMMSRAPVLIAFVSILERIAQRIPGLRQSKMANLQDPGNPHVSLGMSLQRTGNFEAARKMFAVAAQRSPRFNSWMNFCSAAILTGHWNEAERAYNYLIERWPNEIPEHYATTIRQRVIPKGRIVDIDPGPKG